MNYPKRFLEGNFHGEDNGIMVEKKVLNSDYGMHWHDFYEFEFILAGSGTHVLNDRSQRISAGELILLSPVDFHNIQADPDSPLTIINVHFNEFYLQDEIKNLLSSLAPSVTVFQGSDLEKIRTEFEELYQVFHIKNKGHSMLIKNYIGRILIYLYQKKQVNITDYSDFKKAVDFIENHFRENITLNQVAAIAYLSPAYFSEMFHKKCHQTFKNYLIEKRLKWSMTLVKNTSLPISHICYEAGFHSQAYFNKIFKEKYGVSPGSLRKP